MDEVFHFSVAYIVRPEISVEFLCCPASDPKRRTIRKLMGGGGGGGSIKKKLAQGKIK